MADLIANAMAWLGRKRTQFAAVTISYRRGDTVIGPISATRGRTSLNIGGADDVTLTTDVADFIVNVADLVIGLPVEPEAGDQVICNGQVFECRRIFNQDPWRFTDATRRAYRIHTAHVGAV